MLRAQDLYDTVPVYYCSRCLSLKILRFDDSDDPNDCYCEKCGCTNIKEAPIEKWEEMYTNRYKKPYINIKKQY